MAALPVVSGYYMASSCSVGAVGAIGSLGLNGVADSIGSIDLTGPPGPPGPVGSIDLAVPTGHAGSFCSLGVIDYAGLCSVDSGGLTGVLGLSGAVCLPETVLMAPVVATVKSSIMCVQ